MAGHEPGAIARRDTRLLQGRPGVVLGEMALGFAIRQLLETHRRRIEPCAGDEPVKLGPSFTLQVDQQPGCRRATGKAVTPAADRDLQAYAPRQREGLGDVLRLSAIGSALGFGVAMALRDVAVELHRRRQLDRAPQSSAVDVDRGR